MLITQILHQNDFVFLINAYIVNPLKGFEIHNSKSDFKSRFQTLPITVINCLSSKRYQHYFYVNNKTTYHTVKLSDLHSVTDLHSVEAPDFKECDGKVLGCCQKFVVVCRTMSSRSMIETLIQPQSIAPSTATCITVRLLCKLLLLEDMVNHF